MKTLTSVVFIFKEFFKKFLAPHSVSSKAERVRPNSLTDDLVLSEERLRLALAASDIGFYDWNIEKNIIHFNSLMKTEWGIAESKIDSIESAIALIHPDDQQRVRDSIEASIQHSRPYHIEYRVVRPLDGKVTWFDVKGEVQKNQHGDPIRFIGTCVNINERKLSQEKLQESESRFRKLAEAMPQMVFVADAQGNITYFNSKHYEYFGLGRRDSEGWAWKEQQMHHPDDLERTVKAWTEALRTRKSYEVEYRLRRHDGVYLWHLGRAEPIKNESGDVVLWIGTNTDISDLRAIQDRLEDSESKFRTITNALPQMVWSTLPDGFHDYYNKRWYEFTGVPEGTTDGDAWNGIFHPEDQERAWKSWQHSLKTGEVYQIEYRLRHHSGTYRWTLGRALPIRNQDGEIVRWMGSCTEIDDQKRIALELQVAKAEAERASQAKSQFLANMSHEIRSPMNSVMGYADLLTETTVPDSDRLKYAHRIRTSGEHLLNIIDDILDLSKVEAGFLNIEKTRFSITNLVQECVDSVTVLASKKQIKISIEYKDPIPEFIVSDTGRIRQIIMNLLSNSVKFTELGTITLSLGFSDGSENQDPIISIKVADSGIGIPVEKQGHLFQPFSQADSSITRKYGGTGLGLNLSRHLARALGGNLILKRSEPNRGSTFEFTFSCGQLAGTNFLPIGNSMNLITTANSGTDQILSGAKILVVEDSPDNQALMKIYLKKEAAVIDTAFNGQEALDKVAQNEYDIILMDMQMPIMDGLEATRHLRKQGFKKPVVALTAHAFKEEVEKSFQAGCNAHLSKPVSRKDLTEVISKLLLAEPSNAQGIHRS